MGTRGSDILPMKTTLRTKKRSFSPSGSPSGIQVNVEVKEVSAVLGKGLFAKEDIARGTLVWKVLPDLSNVQVFDESQWNVLIESKDLILQQDVLKYSYGDVNFNSYMDNIPKSGVMILPLDESRYINHSDRASANIGDWWLVHSGPGKAPYYHWTYALRDIKKGEELREDYTTFDHTPWIIRAMHEMGVFPRFFDCAVHPRYGTRAREPLLSPGDNLQPDQATMDGATEAAHALLALSYGGESRI